MDQITGRIERISRPFQGGWRRASLYPHGTAVGAMPLDLEVGDHVSFQGEWKDHPKFGKQFEVVSAIKEVPRSLAGMAEYLSKNLPFVGPIVAMEMVDRFGEALWDILENFPDQLTSIRGITMERAAEIHRGYKDIMEDRACDVWFATHRISQNMLARILEQYGTKKKAIEVITANPYSLAEHVDGVGFIKADQIAMALGILSDAPKRIYAGVRWTLKDAAQDEGHCLLPRQQLVIKASQALGVTYEVVEEKITEALANGDLVLVGTDWIYWPHVLRMEQAVAAKVAKMAKIRNPLSGSEITEENLLLMDEDQLEAVTNALSYQLSVMTGGPGVGKSWTIGQIIAAIDFRKKIELAAPTGKAAKRMQELTGRSARTIHRLLEYIPCGRGFHFARNAENPLDCDVLIIDEVSMIDLPLMHALMTAIDPAVTRLVLVGDVDQLPSVGPGKILWDVINCGEVQTTRLKTLYRQKETSVIHYNAQRINAGNKVTFLEGAPDTDMWLIPCPEKLHVGEVVVKIFERARFRWGLEESDIQVLCPKKKGPTGVFELNKLLQETLRGGADLIPGTSFRSGDRVIQTRNNYDLGVFNGEVGFIYRSVDQVSGQDYIIVEFVDTTEVREVIYSMTDIMDLQLAYALTVHKSQGSEFPLVILVAHTTDTYMWKRNLLYTAITRGQKLVIVAGEQKALDYAVKHPDTSVRHTGLAYHIARAETYGTVQIYAGPRPKNADDPAEGQLLLEWDVTEPPTSEGRDG